MRFAPLFAASAIAAGLVGFSAATGQLPPDKAKATDPDLAAIQGEWTVTKFDHTIRGLDIPPEVLKRCGVAVRGDLLTVRPPAEDDRPEPPMTFRLTLDSGKNPRQFDATMLDAKGQPKRRIVYATTKGGKNEDRGPAPPVRAIYKLEAGTLVVCAPVGEEDRRPTAFKAQTSQSPKSLDGDDRGTVVIYLTRKK